MTHQNTPIDRTVVDDVLAQSEVADLGTANIREIVRIVSEIETISQARFVRMEMGVPGLPSPDVGVAAQIEALEHGVSAQYPPIDGIPQLKREASRFARLFLDIEAAPAGCVPVVGSMQGAFATFLTANRNDHTRKGTLFIDPGFPVQKQQCSVLGHEYDSFDIADFRGERLRDQLEEHLKKGEISSILYSNPNNPSWVCLDEAELRIIGETAKKYDVTVIEDLAYFGMDFRVDYGQPGAPPYQPTVARYTDNYVLLLSTSKFFSYAGERVAVIIISDALYNRRYPDLLRYYNSELFGHALIYGAVYALTAGASHSAQYAVAALLKAANDGALNFVAQTQEYGRRAAIMKHAFTDNGFEIVYASTSPSPGRE
jgi:aspartate/methionine/tyrosine aminotransferase